MKRKDIIMTQKEKDNKTAQQNQPTIQVNGQYIKDLSFEAPKMPFLLSKQEQPPTISINIDVNASRINEEAKLFAVELVVKINAKIKEETAFLCELTYGAAVTLNLPAEHVKPVLLIEVPHLLFPFVRAIIANTIQEAGLPPLSLNPIDFAALYRSRMAQEDKQKSTN